MFSRTTSPSRVSQLKVLAVIAAAVLGVKLLVSILLEYRWYFPADFEASPFLTGRRESFTPLYATAFYTHILAGPPVILLGALLMWSRGGGRYRLWHRYAGRGQMLLILAALVPSGLVMARNAFAGPLAGLGFAGLSLATAFCAGMAVWHASARRIPHHQRWATRLFVLLISPLILRLATGGLIVTAWESELAYCLNAWLSWLVPLVAYEAWWRCSDRMKLPAPTAQTSLYSEALR